MPPLLGTVRRELRQIVQLGWPIMIAQLAQYLMGFVDTLMASQAGASDLAAIALGSSLWMPLMLSFSGVLMAITPLTAHQVGADDETGTAKTLLQGWTLALALGIVAILLLNCSPLLLRHLVPDAALAERTAAYLAAISWGFPALMLYQAIRFLSEGFGRTRPVMRIALASMLLNIPLNYLLIFGKFGLPALGGVGCGYASAVVMWVSLLLGIRHLRRDYRFSVLRRHLVWQLPKLPALRAFLRLGAPIGAALLVESSMFCAIALLLAGQGEIAVAAHQITFSTTGLLFMLPLSLALALTIRVGQLTGAGNRAAARFSARCGTALSLLFALLSCVLILSTREWIAATYSDLPAVILLTTQLMSIAALFQFVDYLQVTTAGALRGYKDTRIPLRIVFISYWLIGLPVGHYLARAQGLGAAGYWYGLLVGLACGALLLTLRLNRVSHVPSLAASATTTAQRPAGRLL